MAIDAAKADVDVGGRASVWQGFVLAFTDPKTYLLMVMYHGIVGATGFQNFCEYNIHDSIMLVYH